MTSMIGGKRHGVVDAWSRVVRVVSGRKGPGAVAERAGRFRASEALQQQILALQQQTGPTGGGPGEFDRGAGAGLGWLLAGGAAPLTGAMTGQPPPAAAVVQELAAAEDLIYQRRSSPRREFARGVQDALLWAQYATAAPPVAVPRSPPSAPG